MPFTSQTALGIGTTFTSIFLTQAFRRTTKSIVKSLIAQPYHSLARRPNPSSCSLPRHLIQPPLSPAFYLVRPVTTSSNTTMDETSTTASSNHTHPQTVKRKSPSNTSPTDRPPKQMRSIPDASATASLAPQQQNINGNAAHDNDDAMDIVQSLARVPTTAETAEWQATIENVVKNVVAIHFCQPCSFDTDSAMTSEATGFVVDAERGYILTNRHVVGSGPFWGHCIFDNHEEVYFLS
jgi:hypothetical protein